MISPFSALEIAPKITVADPMGTLTTLDGNAVTPTVMWMPSSAVSQRFNERGGI